MQVCEHHRADPRKKGEMKRLSEQAWEMLLRQYPLAEGENALSQDLCCDQCLRQVASSARSSAMLVRASRERGKETSSPLDTADARKHETRVERSVVLTNFHVLRAEEVKGSS